MVDINPSTVGAQFDDFSQAHKLSDADNEPSSLHHTLGRGPNQAAPGNHGHVTYAPDAEPPDRPAVGDEWRVTDKDNLTREWDGKNWVDRKLGNQALGDITASSVTAGAIDGQTINGVDINGSTITGGTIEGTIINGQTINGGTIEGADIDGSLITGGTIAGSTIHADSVGTTGFGRIRLEYDLDLGKDKISFYSGTYPGSSYSIHFDGSGLYISSGGVSIQFADGPAFNTFFEGFGTGLKLLRSSAVVQSRNANDTAYGEFHGSAFTVFPSELQYKEDVTDIEVDTASVLKKNGAKRWKWKKGAEAEGEEATGLIADTLPDWVKVEGGYTINGVIAFLWTALKQSNARIEKLEAAVAALQQSKPSV